MQTGKPQAGMAYLWMLGVMAAMTVLLGRAVDIAVTQGERIREEELLTVGEEYRQAIGHYVEMPGGNGQYPRQVEELLLDPRFPMPVRHLRQVRRDPETGAALSMLHSPAGALIGVASVSERMPHKLSGFDRQYAAFDGKTKLSEWRFVYEPAPVKPRR
jgi:hypothetical protein